MFKQTTRKVSSAGFTKINGRGCLKAAEVWYNRINTMFENLKFPSTMMVTLATYNLEGHAVIW